MYLFAINKVEGYIEFCFVEDDYWESFGSLDCRTDGKLAKILRKYDLGESQDSIFEPNYGTKKDIKKLLLEDKRFKYSDELETFVSSVR